MTAAREGQGQQGGPRRVRLRTPQLLRRPGHLLYRDAQGLEEPEEPLLVHADAFAPKQDARALVAEMAALGCQATQTFAQFGGARLWRPAHCLGIDMNQAPGPPLKEAVPGHLRQARRCDAPRARSVYFAAYFCDRKGKALRALNFAVAFPIFSPNRMLMRPSRASPRGFHSCGWSVRRGAVSLKTKVGLEPGKRRNVQTREQIRFAGSWARNVRPPTVVVH